MEWNYEGFIDEHGQPVFNTPEEELLDPDGDIIESWRYRLLGK